MSKATENFVSDDSGVGIGDKLPALNNQDPLRQKYPINAMRPAVQDEVIELINSEIMSAKREAHKDGFWDGVNSFTNYYMDSSIHALRQQILPHIALDLFENYTPPVYLSKKSNPNMDEIV